MADGPLSFDVGRVREYAGGIPADDNVLSMIAEGVERAALAYCGRTAWLHVSTTEKLTLRDPSERAFLRHRPVATSPAPTLTLDGITLVLGTDWEVDYPSGILYRLPVGGLWPITTRGLVAVYSHGVAADAATMPGDLVLAMIKQSAYEYKSAGRNGRLGTLRQTLETGAVASEYLVADWAPGVERILGRYRYASA